MGARTALQHIGENMNPLNSLNFGITKKFRPILQTESTECGLACVAMIANFLGYQTTLAEMRSRFPQSLKGTKLSDLVPIAHDLGLGTRALKAEVDEMRQLRLPAILHWNFDHFVVLRSISGRHMVIIDPAVGLRKVDRAEFSSKFTGIAIEVWASPTFATREPLPPIRLASLWGSIQGLRRSLAQIFIMAGCLELLGLLTPLLTQWVIDDVLVSADRDLLNTIVVGFLLLTVVQQLISVTRYWAVLYFGTSLSVQWKAKVFNHLMRLPVNYFEKRHTGDIVSKFGSIDTIQNATTVSLINGIIDGVVALATVTLMLVYSPLLTLIPVGCMLIYAVSRIVRYGPLRDATMEEAILSAKLSSHFLESIRGSKTIKLFCREAVRANSWLSAFANQINASLKIQKIGIVFHSSNAILSAIENILVIWVGSRAVMDGQFSVGVLIAYISYKSQFDAKITSLIDKVFDYRLLSVHMERLSDIVHTPVEPSKGLLHYTGAHDHEDASIEIKDVWFRYSPNDPDVLRGVAAKIASGESVAIAGSSGCGKSTLASLLLGFHNPTAGIIEIGGRPIAELGLEGARGLVSAVLQDDVLFAGTIEANICFFEENPDREWARECARMAKIDREIMQMPMGYSSLVGDMGSALSGGQKQRLMLARAFYKKPLILVLDEATSHLDPTNEALINEEIRSLKITRIVIAHREETIASADRVLYLNAGTLTSRDEAPTKYTASAHSV